MIFGFNTDVKHGESAYHVQSEARQNDLLLQTQVFVKGHCVAKKAASFAAQFVLSGFTEAQMHELLRRQHAAIVEAVRAGNVSAVGSVDSPIEDVGGGLSLRWLNKDSVPHNGECLLRIAVSDRGAGVGGARVTIQPEGQLLDEVESTSNADGVAEATVAIAAGEEREAPVIVTAILGARSATRRFRVRKS